MARVKKDVEGMVNVQEKVTQRSGYVTVMHSGTDGTSYPIIDLKSKSAMAMLTPGMPIEIDLETYELLKGTKDSTGNLIMRLATPKDIADFQQKISKRSGSIVSVGAKKQKIENKPTGDSINHQFVDGVFSNYTKGKVEIAVKLTKSCPSFQTVSAIIDRATQEGLDEIVDAAADSQAMK